MRLLILIFSLTIYLFACTGNCLSCHPNLEKIINDNYHQVLKSCVNCHTTLSEAMTS